MKEIPITLLQVKELLEQRKQEIDLTYIQKVTLDYATRFTANIDREKEEELITNFVSNFNIQKEQAIQLITLNPRTTDEVLLVLGKDYSEEDAERILELCIQYLS